MSMPRPVRTQVQSLALALLLLAFPSKAVADSLTWDPSTTTGITGYVVSYGFAPSVYIAAVDVGNVVTWQLPAFTPGVRYYFAVAAYNASGQYSGPSNEVSWVAPAGASSAPPVVSSPDTPDSEPGGEPPTTSHEPGPYTPPELLSFTTAPGSRVAAGTRVRLVARAVGGVGPLQYRFLVAEPKKPWRVIRDYGADPTADTRPATPGRYRYRVAVRSAGSVEDFDVTASVTLVVHPVKARLELAADRSQPFAPSVPVVLTATLVGSAEPFEYRFLRYRQGAGVWTTLCGYSPSRTCAWEPTAGQQQVAVQARRVGSRAAYEYASATSTFRVARTKARLVSLSVNQTFPLPARTPITLAATAVGGSATLAYQFWRYDGQRARWTIVQPFGPSSSYAWTPSADQWGEYAFRVRVRSAGAGSAYESSAGTAAVNVTP
jgi:hypothetical protein